MYVHVHDQNDNATYASNRWVPIVRHFLACEDVGGGSQQSGGEYIFLPVIWTHFLACEDVAAGSQQSGETFFSQNMLARPVGPHEIRRHFLVAAVDPAVSLSTYSTLPMEVVP